MWLRNIVGVTVCQLVLSTVSAQALNDGFRPLLNGEDLTGWVLVNTPPSTWTVKDGMLVCSGKPIGEIRTQRMYQNFILELEWRHLRPRGNAGVFVWADDITARGVPFHRSIEVQVLENAYGTTRSHTTHGDIFPIHGAKMTPINGRGGSRAFPTEERSKPSPEWNHYRIICVDGEISLAVNGKVVTRGKECSPRKGYICLESEGGIVHYRNLRIKELPDTPIDPQHVAIANRDFRSLYTGLDLSGWGGAKGVLKYWEAKDWVLHYNGEAPTQDASIVTTEALGDFGFVIDVKLSKDSQSVRVLPRGSEHGAIDLDPKDPTIAKHLVKPGRWNRVEGVLRGNRITLVLNGHEVFKDKVYAELPDRGRFKISPSGPADFANIYVRDLSEK